VWVLGAGLALTIAEVDVPAALRDWVGSARDLGIIATVAWFLQRWIAEAAANLRREPRIGSREIDLATIQAVRKVSSLAVWVVTGIIGLETLGFDLTAILTVGGIGGVAIGFASRDVVANFFGGLMIYVMQPFRAGDWIRSPDREIEGTVEEIGWYQTRIRTFDKRPLYVPNAIFPGIAVENPSRMQHRRIKETIGVRYDDFGKLRPILEEVRTMLVAHPDIQTDDVILMVNFDAFASSSLDFFVYTFTKTTDWATYHAVKQDVLLRIGEIIEKHGAEIAFPTRTLHVPEVVRLAQGDGAAPGAGRQADA
jgi:MscS family membrane protein